MKIDVIIIIIITQLVCVQQHSWSVYSVQQLVCVQQLGWSVYSNSSGLCTATRLVCVQQLIWSVYSTSLFLALFMRYCVVLRFSCPSCIFFQFSFRFTVTHGPFGLQLFRILQSACAMCESLSIWRV